MFAISCSQHDTLNIDTGNVNIFMQEDLSSTVSCVADFNYIQMCHRIHARRASVDGSAQPPATIFLMHLPPDPNSQIGLQASAIVKLEDKRDSHLLRAFGLCRITHACLKLAPSSRLSLGEHITLFWTLSWSITNSFCVWLKYGCLTLRFRLSKPALTIWWHLDELFVSSALFNLL